MEVLRCEIKNDKEELTIGEKITIMNDDMWEKIKRSIGYVLNGDIALVEIDAAHPGKLIEIVEELGGEVEDEFETNGWQIDYWVKFTHNGKRYGISGCAYYGDAKVYCM